MQSLVEAASSPQPTPNQPVTVINTLPWERTEVISISGVSGDQSLGISKTCSVLYIFFFNITAFAEVAVVACSKVTKFLLYAFWWGKHLVVNI
ncbi:hypothetical protein FKM82_022221 [Ascaphus truei]